MFEFRRRIVEAMLGVTRPETPPLSRAETIYVYDVAAPENQDIERVRAMLMRGMSGSSEGLDYDAPRTETQGWPVEKVPGTLEAIFVNRFGPEPQGRSYVTLEKLPPTKPQQ